MWMDIKSKINDVNYMERRVEEYIVWMPSVLPCEKMKIKITKSNSDFYTGATNVLIIRKYDNYPEGAGGGGRTTEEALESVISNFLEMVNEDYPKKDYPEGIPQGAIKFAEYSDF